MIIESFTDGAYFDQPPLSFQDTLSEHVISH